MDIKDVNINNVGNLTPQQKSSIYKKAILNVASLIMLKAFVAIFLNKTAQSMQKRADKLN